MRFAICDDDIRDISVLKTALEKICGELCLEFSISTFESGADFLSAYSDINLAYKRNAFDVIFLDIYMRDNGIDTARLVRENDPYTKIVFVSTSPDFALKAYDVFAFSYIVKPFDYEKLKGVVTAAVSDIEKQSEAKLRFKADGFYYSIPLTDIIYVESVKRKTIFHTAFGNTYKSAEALSSVAKRMTDSRFLQPHNSFIVNMDHIVKVENSCFLMSDGGTADITKRFFASVRNSYFDYLSKKMSARENRL